MTEIAATQPCWLDPTLHRGINNVKCRLQFKIVLGCHKWRNLVAQWI